MLICPACRQENPPQFRLCGYCGATLAGAAPAPVPLPVHEVRKTVTIVFSDLKDSTALAERIDTEALHEVKERYFAAMSAEIARHGGKVEKYIGDAVMAVFGLPRAHEDDALRAVRAAHGMQLALRRLNEDLLPRYGVTLGNRTGVNTGEVVANADPNADQKLATGDAVNVAARLEQAAPVGEIYLGDTTWRLVRDAVEVEAVEPLALKGKSERVPAFRLVAVHGQDGNARRMDTPLAGRDEELAVLARAWRDVCDRRTVRLVTVIGEAGLGKSRLVYETTQRHVGAAHVLRGRCLPYGDGITFWPLVEMVGAAAGIGAMDTPPVARQRVLDLVGDEHVAARLCAAIGLSEASFPLQELHWAARRFLSVLARERPVMALIDDIHWAEPAFLELIEHVLDNGGEAPILLLATARHELIERHGDWPERPQAEQLILRPLPVEAAESVVRHLLGHASLSRTMIERIVRAAEGNPLYVEQMLSMLIDSRALQHDDEASGLAGMAGLTADADEEIVVPPTIHALLEARLDGLAREERATVEPAAVAGLEFPRAAIEALAPEPLRPAVDVQLAGLRRKQFIDATAEARYRFHHHLVRDTVYNGLLKRARVNLHLAYVRWADGVNAGRDRALEFEEVLGYHLEQAHRYLKELGPLDEQGRSVGVDAAHRLARAGRRALDRSDLHAAANLLRRAAALLEVTDPRRLEMLPDLGEALMGLGDFAAARAVLDEAESAGLRLGLARVAAASRILLLFVRLYSGEQGGWGADALRTVDGLVPDLEAAQAHDELAMAWRLAVLAHGIAGRYAQVTEAAGRSTEHARRAGNDRLVAKNTSIIVSTALYGPMPVSDGIAECERLIQRGDCNRQTESMVLCTLAQLKAMNGELDAARSLYRRARTQLRDLGDGRVAASTGIDLSRVELLGGDLALAETEALADYQYLERIGETYYRSTIAALLSCIARESGRDADALAYSMVAEQTTAADDVESQALWRSIRAPIIARGGDLAQAESLARAALDLARGTEAPVMQADVLVELSAVLTLADRLAEAAACLEAAMARYSAKGHAVGRARCAALLAGVAAR